MHIICKQYVHYCSEEFGVGHYKTAEALLVLVQHMVLSVAGEVRANNVKNERTETNSRERSTS